MILNLLCLFLVSSAITVWRLEVRAVKRYYWRILYLLDQDDLMVPAQHIATKLGLSSLSVRVVLTRLHKDGYLVLGYDGKRPLVRINYVGKQLIEASHDILVGQPWYGTLVN